MCDVRVGLPRLLEAQTAWQHLRRSRVARGQLHTKALWQVRGRPLARLGLV